MIAGSGEDALIFEPELLQLEATEGIDEAKLAEGRQGLTEQEEEAVDLEAAVSDVLEDEDEDDDTEA